MNILQAVSRNSSILPVIIWICILAGSCDKKIPEPTLENSDYNGVSRIVILSNSLNTSTTSGYGFAGNEYTFTVRGQSKDGLLLMKLDVLDAHNNIISDAQNNSNNSDNNAQQNFSNVNITDYTGTFSLEIPASSKDSVIVKATMIDKIEHEEFAYFIIYLKTIPFSLYFNTEQYTGDSVTSKTVNAGTELKLYLLTESYIKPGLITYHFYRRSTQISEDGFSKKSTFGYTTNLEYYYDDITIKTLDTGFYILSAYSKTANGSADTARVIINSLPPKVTSSQTVSLGAQNNTVLGISYYFDYYYGNQYGNTYTQLRNTNYPKSTFSYVYDNGMPYLISLYERKNANIYGDSLFENFQNTIFIELDLPVSSYDTISSNYVFRMPLSNKSPGKIAISTSKLIGYQDADKNRGVVRINSIVVGSTGSINFSTKYQYKLGSE